ncbi:MarR family transcriptional regulator [Sphingomonas sp. RHCKR47]|uniref:LexA family protein n=1 Tax=Sphingomonas citricola TaxID=2862498 RepID=UPI001CA4C4EC|nr:helix-turn-helix domain-containing protein [Sphingomonas citricola]MBW6524435.1 MarR family transcriptional regulator [Sphingomonas citricola]
MIEPNSIPVPFTTSATDRVLSAVRAYRREHGRSPTLGEIARRALVRRQHVARYLKRLQEAGYLVYDRRAAEPITLVDLAANLSDLDLENGCHGRGWTVIKSAVPNLTTSFPVDPVVPNWELPLVDKLQHIE